MAMPKTTAELKTYVEKPITLPLYALVGIGALFLFTLLFALMRSGGGAPNSINATGGSEQSAECTSYHTHMQVPGGSYPDQ
jgi:hypothetical protein